MLKCRSWVLAVLCLAAIAVRANASIAESVQSPDHDNLTSTAKAFPSDSTDFDIPVATDAAITGSFTEGALADSHADWEVVGGNVILHNSSIAPLPDPPVGTRVPEPSTLFLSGSGLIALARLLGRKLPVRRFRSWNRCAPDIA